MNQAVAKWASRLHIYLGIVCAPYFLVYGFSTLSWNHPNSAFFASAEEAGTEETSTWTALLEAAPRGSDLEIADSIATSLGLFGHIPQWGLKRRGEILSFAVNRPGARFTLEFTPGSRSVRVLETRKGLWSVLRGIHGMTVLPRSVWAWSWGAYTVVSIVALLVASLSGFLLIWRKATTRRSPWTWLVLAFGSGTVFITMFALWW